MSDFTELPDLASRALAGSVIWATDESFAERENLIMAHEPRFDPEEFGNKGKVYDGWETRRRRHDEIGGHDSAVVRLGVPGRVEGVVVDTAWFTGNYPPQVAVHGLTCDRYLPAEEIAESDGWVELVPPTDARGDHRHLFEVSCGQRLTHIRLDMIPDGGIARLRVHGQPSPDPRFLQGTIDLAAMENGGRVIGCSNMFYSHPNQLIGLGRSRNMGGGWENARRRSRGNDFVTIALAAEGRPRWIEVDTSYYVYNAPGDVQVTGVTATGDQVPLVPFSRSLPDTRHRFLVEGDTPIVGVRVDVHPDGGMARLRVWGELTDEGMATLEKRWGLS